MMIELEAWQLAAIVFGSAWLGVMVGMFLACLCVVAKEGGGGE